MPICTIPIQQQDYRENNKKALSGATNHIKSFKICTIPIQQQDYSRK